MRLAALVLGLAGALLISACGDNIRPQDQPDAPRVDARVDGPPGDASPDAPDGPMIDAMIDAMPDGMADAMPDAMVDAAPDMMVLIDAPDAPTIDAAIDAAVDATVDAAIDGPPIDAPISTFTFTQYVIDLIQNRTANNTEPAPFSEFAALLDPDATAPDNAAYASLFP